MISQLATILAAAAGIGWDAPAVTRYPVEWRTVPSDSPFATVSATVQPPVAAAPIQAAPAYAAPAAMPAPIAVPMNGSAPIAGAPTNITVHQGAMPATPLLNGAPCTACAEAAKVEEPKAPPQWTISGWVVGSFAFNPSGPTSKFNGPVTFNDRSNDFLLNQAVIRFGRDVDTSSDKMNFGGKVDVMYGSDAVFTQALGLDRSIIDASYYHRLALPQIFGEVYLPKLKTSVKAGHFYTPIGYDVVPTPDNFFATLPYTFQYGEPFTHTGVLANTALGDKLSVMYGYVMGWDSWRDNNSDGSFLGGVTWTDKDAGTTLAFTTIVGPEQDKPGIVYQGIPGPQRRDRFMYSLVLQQKLGDKLKYILQHDAGFQDLPGGAFAPGTTQAEWYGLNQYLLYDVSEKLSLGVRGEWWRDDDGFRLAGYPVRQSSNAPFFPVGVAANYYALTLGANYKACENLILRPELRFDWQDRDNSAGGAGRAFDDGTKTTQTLLSMNVIYKF